jgi:spore germination cell wall hydrolase CwlJ-like protein
LTILKAAGRASAFLVAFTLMFAGSTQALAQQVGSPAIAAVQSVVQATATIAATPVRAAQSIAAPLAAPPASAPSIPVPVPTPMVAAIPLEALVAANAAGTALDEQATCLATAVYFESMGEPLQGQLAVANVVINRANSGRYPSSWCGVVKQKAQFSFVRNGRFPPVDNDCAAWRRAQAIARIASARLASALPADVLWYHADYVAPSWGRRLSRVEKIGAHIFYRA